MRADDVRHGTVAGYLAHRRSGLPRCEDCLRAWGRYDKRRKMLGGFTISTAATQRRIQALHCLGWSRTDIARECGYTEGSALKTVMSHPTMSVTTANKIAAVYERLCMTLGTGPKADWWRRKADSEGWLPPLAYDDIEAVDDLEDITVHSSLIVTNKYIDEIVLEKALGYDLNIPMTKAERAAVIRLWVQRGRSLAELERLSGWNVHRELRGAVA